MNHRGTIVQWLALLVRVRVGSILFVAFIRCGLLLFQLLTLDSVYNTFFGGCATPGPTFWILLLFDNLFREVEGDLA
jgi:hypothetical protein